MKIISFKICPFVQRVTALLEAWGRGEAAALDELLPLVYTELRRIAGRQLNRERKTTVVMVTHDHESSKAADRTVRLHVGYRSPRADAGAGLTESAL